MHAEQVLATAGLTVRRLDENAVASLFATWMGPAASTATRRGRPGPRVVARRAGGRHLVDDLRDQPARGDDVLDRVARLAAVAPTPVVGTSLVLQPDRAGGASVETTLLVRLSAPGVRPARRRRSTRCALLAQAFDLRLRRVDGEQGALLRATTPFGVGEPV